MDFFYRISGFAVGFIVGLTGVGGGSLRGIYFTSDVGAQIPERTLRRDLASVLVVIGGRLAW
ncbi:MAG TPA: hypothetical protein VLV32_04880 [Burkholderiales bacterium]|nr:hypothetical protein [Burkholderiales bacterium]